MKNKTRFAGIILSITVLFIMLGGCEDTGALYDSDVPIDKGIEELSANIIDHEYMRSQDSDEGISPESDPLISDSETNRPFDADEKNALLVEDSSRSTGSYGFTWGYSPHAHGSYSTAGGYDCDAYGHSSVSVGYDNFAWDTGAVALGMQNTAYGYGSTTLGRGNYSGGKYSTTMGRATTASGEASVAMGWEIQAGADHVVAIGLDDMNQMVCNQANSMCIMGGNVGIGESTPQEKLEVRGTIRAEEIIVESDWADFVFEDGYKLMSLENIEKFIITNGHLPEVPTANEVQTAGVAIGSSQAILLQKIEELTLHLIDQNKRISELQAKVTSLGN